MDIPKIKAQVTERLENDGIVILPPMDEHNSLQLIKELDLKATVTMLDPWYNRGAGGVRNDYVEFIIGILNNAKDVTEHLYLWGFPEIVALFVDKIPTPLKFSTWLTWYYKNNPSVIKGWRSSQQACLHLCTPDAKMFPEHFFNEEQKERYGQMKMRFIPGPPSVIEDSLLVGFVGKKEQTSHPAQKPLSLFQKLLLMVTKEGDLAIDPMCGSGTTGEACMKLGVKSIISDISEEYTQICETRLGVKRLKLKEKKAYAVSRHKTVKIIEKQEKITLSSK